MTKEIHHIIASYDIHDPKRLQKVARAMKDYGMRVLKSVFECNLGEAQFNRMKSKIDKIIDHTEDSVRYYFVCDKCIQNVEYSGSGQGFVEDEELIIA